MAAQIENSRQTPRGDEKPRRTSKGGTFSGNGGAADFKDVLTMASVFGKLKSLAAPFSSGLQVPVGALVEAPG